MHDARFETLTEVLEHYNTDVQDHPNLDPRLIEPGSQPPTPRVLGLDATELTALEALLRALTDGELLVDPKYSDPFITAE